jgi:hypothetical protein
MIRVLRETHEAPRHIRDRIARAGGSNVFGEPNFRVVWGWNRLTWIGGVWEDRDASGNLIRRVAELRREPKYVPFDRWHIERWMPAESYGSPREWYLKTIDVDARGENGRSIAALGPFPHRGEYEHCFTLSGLRGEFIPLTPAAVEHVVRAILWARQESPARSRHAIHRDWERRERAWHNLADAALDLPSLT